MLQIVHHRQRLMLTLHDRGGDRPKEFKASALPDEIKGYAGTLEIIQSCSLWGRS